MPDERKPVRIAWWELSIFCVNASPTNLIKFSLQLEAGYANAARMTDGKPLAANLPVDFQKSNRRTLDEAHIDWHCRDYQPALHRRARGRSADGALYQGACLHRAPLQLDVLLCRRQRWLQLRKVERHFPPDWQHRRGLVSQRKHIEPDWRHWRRPDR